MSASRSLRDFGLARWLEKICLNKSKGEKNIILNIQNNLKILEKKEELKEIEKMEDIKEEQIEPKKKNVAIHYTKTIEFDFNSKQDQQLGEELIKKFENIFQADISKRTVKLSSSNNKTKIIKSLKGITEELIIFFLICTAVAKLNIWSLIYVIYAIYLILTKKTMKNYYILFCFVICSIIVQLSLFVSNLQKGTDPSADKADLEIMSKTFILPWYKYYGMKDERAFFFGLGVCHSQINLIWMDFLQVVIIYIYLDYFSYSIYQEGKTIGKSESQINYYNLHLNSEIREVSKQLSQDEYDKHISCMKYNFGIEIDNKVNDLNNITNQSEINLKKLNENFKNLEKRLLKLETKKQELNKRPKEQNDYISKDNTLSDDQRKDMKKYKRQKPTQNNISERNHMITKNYRIIKQKEENIPQEQKYISQTFNRGNQLTSHSVNRLNIRPENAIDNKIEYQVYTKPRSRSKEHKSNKVQQNLDNQPKKYKIKNYQYSNTEVNQYQYESGINDSCIIQEDDVEFIENKLQEIYPNSNISYNLVYRASEDGDKSLDFHKRCDKIGPNITFIKTLKGYIFGGFTVKNWEHLKRDINVNKPNLGSASRDPKAFGFSVNYQKIYNNEKKNEFAIWCNRNYGPTFKNNFFQIFDNCLKKGGYCSLKNNSHFGGQNSDYEITGGEQRFGVYEVEVFELIFE